VRFDKSTCHARSKSAGIVEGRSGVGLMFARIGTSSAVESGNEDRYRSISMVRVERDVGH
jgi:hypothetical protein